MTDVLSLGLNIENETGQVIRSCRSAVELYMSKSGVVEYLVQILS